MRNVKHYLSLFTILLLSALLLSAFAFPDRSVNDEFEPDNTPGEASEIFSAEEEQTRDLLPASDIDWITFTLEVPSSVYIHAYTDDTTEIYLEVLDDPYSTTPSVIAMQQASDIEVNLGDCSSNVSLEPGVYHISISDELVVGVDPYHVYFEASPCDTTPPTGDEYEPDNNKNEAKAIEAFGSQDHTIIPADDEDWVTFELTTTSGIYVGAIGGDGDEVEMWIYDAALTEIAYVAADTAAGTHAEFHRECIPDPLPAGTYYAKIAEMGSDNEIANYSIYFEPNACSGTPPVAEADEFEPDNSDSEAEPIEEGVAQTHSIYPVGDTDWVTFDLAEESNAHIEVIGDIGDDFEVWLKDGTVAEIDYSDSADSVSATIERTCDSEPLQPGTYYIEVAELDGDSEIPSYDIKFNSIHCGTPHVGDDFEPDNHPGEAKFIDLGETQNRSILPEGDKDWVMFNLPRQSSVSIITDGDAGNTHMILYRSIPGGTMTEIASDTPDSGFASIELGCDSSTDNPGLPSGAYFVEMKGLAGETVDNYTITYNSNPCDTTTAEADIYEPDNTSDEAKPITPFEPQEHNIHPEGDVDWVMFDLPGHSSIYLNTWGSEPLPSVTLYDSNMTELVSNPFEVVWNCDGLLLNDGTTDNRKLITGTYYLKMEETSGIALDAYFVSVDVHPCQAVGAEDEYEPDGTSSEAKPIEPFNSQRHSIFPVGDYDWMMFELTEESAIAINTDSPNINDDTEILLYDGNGVAISYNDQSGNGNLSEILWRCDGSHTPPPSGMSDISTTEGLPSGTYYFVAGEWGSDKIITAYDIELKSFPCDSTAATDEHEPDNNVDDVHDFSFARPITNHEWQQHSISPVGDVDWITFVITKESHVFIGTGGPAGDTEMWLYEKIGGDISEVEYNDQSPDGGDFAVIDRECFLDALLPGEYFVKTADWGQDEEIPLYELGLVIVPCETSLEGASDEYEPDNSFSGSNRIRSGDIQIHSIWPAGDTDWLIFDLTEESGVNILVGGMEGDMEMWLSKSDTDTSDLEPVGYNDNDNGLFPAIQRVCGGENQQEALEEGTYYVKLKSKHGDQKIDGYEVFFEAIPCSTYDPDDVEELTCEEDKNFIKNGDFESSTYDWAGLQEDEWTTVDFTTEEKYTKDRSIVMTSKAPGSSMFLAQEVPLPKDIRSLTFEFALRQTDMAGELLVNFLDQDFNLLHAQMVKPDTVDTWQYYTLDITPLIYGLRDKSLVVKFDVVGGEQPMSFYIDGVKLLTKCSGEAMCRKALIDGGLDDRAPVGEGWLFEGSAGFYSTATHIHDGDSSGIIGGSAGGRIKQSFVLHDSDRSLILEYWQYIEETPTENLVVYFTQTTGIPARLMPVREARLGQYNRSIGDDPIVGKWEKIRKEYSIPSNFTIANLDLVFEVAGETTPVSTYWIDDVSLNVCPIPPHAKNDFVRTDVRLTKGTFSIGTTDGDPDITGDEHKGLLYGFEQDGYSDMWSSYATLRVEEIDGNITDVDLSEFRPDQPPFIDEDDTVVTTWFSKDFGLEVSQYVSIIENEHSERKDTVLIEYSITSFNPEPIKVGLRSMMDVRIGSNDGAPYFIPDVGQVIYETEFVGDDVPEYWRAFESANFIANALKAQGTLRTGTTPPDRFIIGRWGNADLGQTDGLYWHEWDYTVDTTALVTEDSAVALYWNPVPLNALENVSFATYYGLAGEGGGEAWLEAPSEVTCDGLEFNASMWLVNNSGSTIEGAIATLATLPSGVRLISGQGLTKDIPTIETGEAQGVVWKLAASGDVSGTVTLSASVDFDTENTYKTEVLIPKCEVQLDTPTDIDARSGFSSIVIEWQPSTSYNIEGYNVYRSEGSFNAATAQKINSATVTDNYYEDSTGLTSDIDYYYAVKAVAGSSESGFSSSDHAQVGQLNLVIPNSYGKNGTVITVPIKIANANNLAIGDSDIFVRYQKSVLNAQILASTNSAVGRTALTQKYKFISAIEEPSASPTGTVKITILHDTSIVGEPDTLYGDGTLFEVYLKVVGEQGVQGSSPLIIVEARTNVYPYTEQGTSDTTVPLALDSGQFRVQATFIFGDLNGDGVVNNTDVDIALQIAVALISPSDDQRNAGDVNGDQRIDSADVALISRISTGLDTVPSAKILKMLMKRAGSEVNVSFGTPYFDANGVSKVASFHGNPGSTVSVPINIDKNGDILAGADLCVNYDPTLLEVSDVKLGSDTNGKGFVLSSNSKTAGTVKIGLGQIQSGTNQGLGSGVNSAELVTVDFKIKDSAQNGKSSPLVLSCADLNDTYSQDFETSSLQQDVKTELGQSSVSVGEAGEENFIYLPIVLK